MTSWRKHYRVGEGKQELGLRREERWSGQNEEEKSRQKKKNKRRRRLVLLLMFFSFIVGLGIGLREDFEAEILLPQTLNTILGEVEGEDSENNYSFLSQPTNFAHIGGAHTFCTISRGYTRHFYDRIECRDISLSEVDFVLRYGVVKRYFPDHRNKHTQEPEPKFNLVAKTHTGRDILVSFTVTLDLDSLVLITAYPDNGRKDNCN